jgi:hypothetical protein
MIRNLSLLVLGSAALAACNPNPTTVVANEAPDPTAAELANAAPVELPPAIAASKTYRCKDNSLLYIDWYSDGSARVKTEKGVGGTQVPAPVEGVTSPLTGTAQASSITYEGKTCHV